MPGYSSSSGGRARSSCSPSYERPCMGQKDWARWAVQSHGRLCWLLRHDCYHAEHSLLQQCGP
jgi:hypothetical protein